MMPFNFYRTKDPLTATLNILMGNVLRVLQITELSQWYFEKKPKGKKYTPEKC